MSDLFSLTKKSILVSGASSGIGRQIAITLSNQDACLILTGRNQNRLEVTLNLLSGNGHSSLNCDLLDESSQDDLIKALPNLNGIVFAAGVNEYIPVKFINKKKAELIFNTNFFSQIYLTQKLVKQKKINHGGSLVFISSIASMLGVPGTLLYAASKAALNTSVKVLASELSQQKIRVNAICPGIIRTPMIEENNTVDIETFNEQEKQYPLGFGRPEDVANAVVFYLSESSRWITGNIMVLDGGFSLA